MPTTSNEERGGETAAKYSISLVSGKTDDVLCSALHIISQRLPLLYLESHKGKVAATI